MAAWADGVPSCRLQFNQRLADLAPNRESRHPIDGIILTKFDTIDDKASGAGVVAITALEGQVLEGSATNDCMEPLLPTRL